MEEEKRAIEPQNGETPEEKPPFTQLQEQANFRMGAVRHRDHRDHQLAALHCPAGLAADRQELV